MAPERRGSASGEGGYLVEFVRIGNSAKVSAIDPETGTEVSIVGPASAGEAILSRNAVAKLVRKLQSKTTDGQ